jgi:predicted metalloprotease with PDZ domain
MLAGNSAFGAHLLRYTIRFEPFEVELTLPNGEKQKRSLPRQPSYFSHRADHRWPIPDGPADERVRCEIQWVGFPPDWRLVSSWNIDRRVEKVDTTIRGLRKAVFVGGDFRTARSKKGLVLVTRGRWSFSDESVLALMDQVAESLTAVWRDRGVTNHRVFLVPWERNWGGEGRTNSLIIEGSPTGYDPRDFPRLLAHEMLHEWNPRRLNSSDDETLYWFTEGFTEYYAVAGVWRAGIWTFDQVLDHFNKQARSYYGSSARNLTPSRMVALRQSDLAANRLPYLQGYLLAAHWNLSGKSLDVAMRNLIKNNREPLS